MTNRHGVTERDLEAGLTALRLIQAQLDHDEGTAQVVAEPWTTDAGPVISYLIWLSARLLDGHPAGPHVAIDMMRAGIVQAIAEMP